MELVKSESGALFIGWCVRLPLGTNVEFLENIEDFNGKFLKISCERRLYLVPKSHVEAIQDTKFLRTVA